MSKSFSIIASHPSWSICHALTSSALISFMEYLVIVSEVSQFFFKNPVRRVAGFFTPSDIPGAGMDLDEGKIESEREITFGK